MSKYGELATLFHQKVQFFLTYFVKNIFTCSAVIFKMNCVWFLAFKPDFFLAYVALVVKKNHEMEVNLNSITGFFMLKIVDAISMQHDQS